ncbi:MAG TPA: peptidoglycan-binding domain-containing protein, partial [Acidimicrobiales bacterium]
LAGLTATAGPAAAAEPRCDHAGSTWTGVYGNTHVWVPMGSQSLNCYMNRGEVGEEVRAMQTALVNCYGAGISIDGQFGPRTQTALRAAEASHGMTSDLGRYSSYDAWNLRFWGWYEDSNGNVRWRCSRMDGPILP